MPLPDGFTDVPPGKLAAIVTSLEMLAPAPIRPGPAGPWTVRQVEAPALDWYREIYLRIGRDWIWVSRLVIRGDDLSAILRSPDVEVYTLTVDGRDEGLLELDFREPGVCELAFFGVAPAYVGRGAGRFLMNRAIEIAWARPIRRFWVHTCTFDHPAAPNFYQRSGFRAYRRQVEVLDDPRLTGLFPQNAAPHIPVIGA